MKTIITNWILIIAIFSITQSQIYSQDWNTGGNNLFQTGILGNSANFDIIFRTDGINRMQLMETGNTTIDGYTVPYDGHLGLSITPSFFGTTGAGRAPFSLLHLNGEGNSVFGTPGSRLPRLDEAWNHIHP